MKPIDFAELELIINKKEAMLLFLSTYEQHNHMDNLFFYDPVEILSTQDSSQVNNILDQVDKKVKEGFWAAGYISYEAGYSFEDKLNERRKYPFPLVWFGIFRKPFFLDYSRKEILKWMDSISKKSYVSVTNLDSLNNKNYYLQAVNKIKQYISQGDIYQANYTFKKRFWYDGDPFNMFCRLNITQPVGYSVYINNNNNAVLSLSPELFFSKDGNNVTVKPMKGTTKRGKTIVDDLRISRELSSCLKNRAENIMIVDLMRNDLGKISEIGSVKTTKLFDVASYSTLFQMTSTVKAEMREDLSYCELFKNIFPGGSVTGAPKIRAMEIIKETETEPRGIYTGGIGYISPSEKAVFNIAIRTLCLDKNAKTGELGIGSGIVADSDPEKEFEECVLKSNFMSGKYDEFKLIETMLWEKEKFFLLDLHINRLSESAGYFDFYCDKIFVINELRKISVDFDLDKKYKVRLLLDRYGNVSIETQVLNEQFFSGDNFIMVSGEKICSDSVFFYHKTTNRDFYYNHFQRYRQKGCFDVIFMNERDEITEGAISNVFIKKDGVYYTPPVHCGLLNGTFREFFIRENFHRVNEKVIYKTDLLSADEIILTNSVRGIVKVKLKELCTNKS